jgi:limonene-1,2-epoxide hydrolase
LAWLSLSTAVNAVERYMAASASGEVEAAVAEFAPDVVMRNPATDDPVVGKDAVAAAIRGVGTACDEFRHTRLLVDAASGETPLYGLVFEARVGEATLRGVDLIELDDSDRISTFTVLARPVSALMALGARMSEARKA